jgi:hypothetical protein
VPRVTLESFVGPSNTLRSIQADCDETINLFLESVAPGNGKAPVYLQGTPGIRPFTLFPDQPIRGLFSINERAYVVGGASFAELFSNGTFGTIYPVSNDGRPASFASNGTAGNQLLILSGGNLGGQAGYIYNTNTLTFTPIVDPDFPAYAKMCDFLNGYFLVMGGHGTRSFSWSNLEDGLTWDTLDVAERSSTSDNLAALIRSHEELWLLGGQTTQVYWNSGQASEIFAPVSGVVIEQGTVGSFTVQRLDNTLIWVGANVDGARMVWRADGYTPKRISTFGVEQDLQKYSDDGQALTFQMNGHLFYALIQPQNLWTWLYDVTMDRWTKWSIWNPTTAQWMPHVAGSHMWCFEKHLVGDRYSGAIYEMNMGFFTDEVVAPL